MSCSRLPYVLRGLRAHSLPQQSLEDIFRETIKAELISTPRLHGPASVLQETVSS